MKQPWVHGRARRDGLVHVGNEAIGTLCGRRMRFTEPDVPLPTCRRCVSVAMTRGGVIYLLHFERPFGHARHYMGWSQDLWVRLICHQMGRGANLLRHVAIAGIQWRLVALYYGDRNLERAMKNHGHARRCPECRTWEAFDATGRFLHNDDVPTSSTASGG